LLPSKLAKRSCFLLFLLIIAFYFYGLGHLPFVGPDEPRYAEVAREMWRRGDLITPTLAGLPWFEKPVLLYWLIEAAFAVFGVSEWAARLGPAACGVLMIPAVYWVGKRVEILSGDPELRNLGCWSALILATTPAMIVFSRGVSFDIVVTTTLTWALTFYLLAELDESGERRRWFLIGFYVLVGLSLLAKGLIGIAIPFGVITFYYLLRRRLFPRWFIISLTWGLPLALAVAAIWYGPAIARHGWRFIDEFIIQHHFKRYLSNKYHHPQPFFYYLLIIFPMALPWIALSIHSIAKARNWDWRGESSSHRLRIFALAWILFPLLFFSFSGSKLPGYILPVIPAMALLGGERLSRIITGGDRSWTMSIMLLVLVVAGIGIVAFAIISRTFNVWCASVIAAPLFIGGLLDLQLRTQRAVAALVIGFAVVLSFFVALNCEIPAMSESHSSRQLIQAATERGYGSAPVYALHEIDRSVEFYAADRVVYDAAGQPVKFEGPQEVLAAARKRNGPILVVVPLEHLDQLKQLRNANVDLIAENGVLALVAVTPL
jgi:4-amino-4-deoxy-L-arabinose transferase-like glycosyltransferase